MAKAYASLAFINCCLEWDWPTAEQNYLKAIALKPNYPTAHHWYGELLITAARFDEGMVQLRMAQELDPLSLAIKPIWLPRSTTRVSMTEVKTNSRTCLS
jgi:Tfp pilus assembly protein PilF